MLWHNFVTIESYYIEWNQPSKVIVFPTLYYYWTFSCPNAQLNVDAISIFIGHFKHFDKDQSGAIERGEFALLFENLQDHGYVLAVAL